MQLQGWATHGELKALAVSGLSPIALCARARLPRARKPWTPARWVTSPTLAASAAWRCVEWLPKTDINKKLAALAPIVGANIHLGVYLASSRLAC